MTTKDRINDHNLCIVCSRRAEGLAVGEPEKLGWYCDDCGPKVAKEALMSKKFDVFEERACTAVAELCGLSEIVLTKDELPQFIRWTVEEFGNELRKQLDGGKAPF